MEMEREGNDVDGVPMALHWGLKKGSFQAIRKVVVVV